MRVSTCMRAEFSEKTHVSSNLWSKLCIHFCFTTPMCQIVPLKNRQADAFLDFRAESEAHHKYEAFVWQFLAKRGCCMRFELKISFFFWHWLCFRTCCYLLGWIWPFLSPPARREYTRCITDVCLHLVPVTVVHSDAVFLTGTQSSSLELVNLRKKAYWNFPPHEYHLRSLSRYMGWAHVRPHRYWNTLQSSRHLGRECRRLHTTIWWELTKHYCKRWLCEQATRRTRGSN